MEDHVFMLEKSIMMMEKKVAKGFASVATDIVILSALILKLVVTAPNSNKDVELAKSASSPTTLIPPLFIVNDNILNDSQNILIPSELHNNLKCPKF